MSEIAPGWYQASGDPAGTVRWWDGNRWVGEPQQVDDTTSELAVRIAPISDRVSGRFLDWLVLLALTLPLMWPVISDGLNLASSVSSSDPEAPTIRPLASWRIAAIAAIRVLYDWGFYAFKGATPGKLMVGTRVVTLDGHKTPLGIGKGLLRALFSVVMAGAVFTAVPDEFFTWPVLIIGAVSLIMMRNGDRNRSVMDRVASTVVIMKPTPQK